MADARFDRGRFAARLATRRLGRTLLVRATTGSTNDDAWEALAAGGPDGLAVVADAQTRGRGRAGRRWLQAPGLGLALSLALRPGGAARHPGLVPLAAGLALARALTALGAPARLKWPNDVLLAGRKAAGVLCEMRRGPHGDAIVIGAGVNVRHAAADFPPELQGRATSLALAGVDAAVEDVAADFLAALEPLWEALQAGDAEAVRGGWSALAAFWGERVTVATPGGGVDGVARGLDAGGGLVLRLDSGVETTVLAGDLAAVPGGGGAA